ncbi:S8 family serine peptidase [Flavobacterium magnum]|uniref:S8 family serine peptidase n=1 Tax=Flavobacterium magnum TaxID=2162713 RepID=UPI0015E68ACF|nr:S8 family serine peptidase [Flavobacterium magnum]
MKTLSRINALVAVAMLISAAAFSQNAKQVGEIVKTYDLNKLKSLEQRYTRKSEIEKKKALEAAAVNGWPEFRTARDGSYEELMKLSPQGFPIYYSTSNVNAANSTRANVLQSVYNLKGQGMTARIWDGGKVRASHQEFGGRVAVVDATAGPDGNNFHSTHVTGTVVAAGVDPAAKGMAPMANARTFNWTNDTGEALSEVQAGMLLSNHSYGVPSTSVPGWYIGSYDDDARSWDEIAYNSPYYLMVASAGNNGDDLNSQGSTSGFDKLTGNKVSKNNLVVANCQDAVISQSGNLVSVSINSSSSQGPADDLRIKPDITGNGTNLYSTFEGSDTDYGSISGTSMASPNVMGTLLLLQQHYNNVNQHFMKSATLKALACHTADDAGISGPDAVFGWGLLNGKKAAEAISGNGTASVITEETLTQGQTFSMTVNASGVSPLMATIAWTDVPGNVGSGNLNDTTPALVNDLDIRVTKNAAVYFPWKLRANANLAATNTSDNNVDNVERVDVLNATGTYTITVTHKGTLVGGSQKFSLIVTGTDSEFSLTPSSPDQVVCSSGTASYSFNFNTTSFNTTTFSAVGLPPGVVATFSEPSLALPDAVTMTLSNLQVLAPGDYVVGFKGQTDTEEEIKNVNLRIYTPEFGNVQLNAPANMQQGLATTLNLDWEPDNNAQSYRLQVATTPDFITLMTDTVTTQTDYTLTGLNEATKYYWRVLPINICGQAASNTINRFDTGSQTCNIVYTATDYSNAAIADTANSVGSVPINVSGGMTVGNLSVNLNIAHTYIEDFTVYLEGPDAIGNPFIRLFEEPCGDNDNIIATVSDAGTPFVCGANPGISGTVRPVDPLSSFNSMPADGIWTLYVVDAYNGDGGTINNFSLNFCNVVPANLNTGSQQFEAAISVYPNPTKGVLNVRLPDGADATTITLYDLRGRKIFSKQTQAVSDSMNISSLEDGIYVLSFENDKFRVSKKVVLSK